MVNLNLFRTLRGLLAPVAGTRNAEGAPAYALSPEHALAQLAATGTLHGTFYASDAEQLDELVELARQVEPGFLARTALWARQHGHMKDVPALLLALLATRDLALFERVFPRVIDNGRMLRTFVQILRSGAAGRRSFGSAPKRALREWLACRSEDELLRATTGQSPSLSDIVRMLHPKPATDARRAFYGWLLGREHVEADLTELVRSFENRKRDAQAPLPAVPFELLTSLELSTAEWVTVARRASWQQTRMNLNTFARHGVYAADPEVIGLHAARLCDATALAQARVLPYQLLAAWKSASPALPAALTAALQDALELATANVPAWTGRIVVCPDVSGSMQSPVTGRRGSATSAVRCIDVAALVTACVLRKNPTARVLPFEQTVVDVRLNPRDSVVTLASQLAAVGGGGTNCSAPLAQLNRERDEADLVLFVSDNQSWVDARQGATEMLQQWNALRARCPQARLVCLDLQPGTTTQALERLDVLNVGGFSDQVFTLISDFAAGRLASDHWVGVIGALEA